MRFISSLILLRSSIILIGFSLFVWPTIAIADTEADKDKEKENHYEQLWDLATLYKNDTNPIIEEFKLRGRYQNQYFWLNSDRGDRDFLENRRSRFGFDAWLFGGAIEVQLDAQSNSQFHPLYDGLVDSYIRWNATDTFSLTFGKQKPQIGYYDWLQSSNAQPTFERSQIFNQLNVNRLTGIVAEGGIDRFSWQSGLYSNDTNREFGHFDGGLSIGAGIGYNFKESLGISKADWRFDWLHSNSNSADTVLNRYDNLLSSTVWLDNGQWGFVGEAFLGIGKLPDVFGYYLQPTYDLIPHLLQAVGRYSFAIGDGGQSVFLQSRYETTASNLAGANTGRIYQAVYLGLQYFLYGNQLKLMMGAEYSRLDGGTSGGFNGLTFLNGIRLSF